MAINYFETRLGREKSNTQSGSKPSEPNFIEIAPPLIYPPEMRGDTSRPCIQFVAHERKLSGVVIRHTIWFPAPAGLQFGDSGDYGTTDLGLMAGAVDTVSGRSGVGNILSQISTLNKEQAKSLGSKLLPEQYKDSVSLATQQINNPNTNTTFNSNGVRSFSFQFKMIARSASESNLIREIQTKFRRFIYASRGGENNTITLEYPPVWTVKFMNMDTGTENIYIPRIYSTYCKAVNTNFNATGNVYFTDNAPLEVDLTVEFQETRALNRHDIDQMMNDQLGNRGISETGRPLTVTSIEQPDPAPTKNG
jgi:hypothetical protein